jgi:putative NADPH-quinone reductase
MAAAPAPRHSPDMTKRVLIIDGHPDAAPHLIHDLADAYAEGARSAGHDVRRIDLSAMDVPILHSPSTWTRPAAGKMAEAQEEIRRAGHIAIFYPLWLGDMPALLKAFFEQVMRPGFAFDENARPGRAGLLKGRSAVVVVTMGMPATIYRVAYRAHSVKSLERNILKLVGIAPIQHVLIGGVDGEPHDYRGWLDEMFGLGELGACEA